MSAPEYQVIIPNTRLVIYIAPSLDRAKEVADFQLRRLRREVVVDRVVPATNSRRRVWTARLAVHA